MIDDIHRTARRLLRDLEKSGAIEIDEKQQCQDELVEVLAERFSFAAASGNLDLNAIATMVARSLLNTEAVGEVFLGDPELEARITTKLQEECTVPEQPSSPVGQGPHNLDELNEAFATNPEAESFAEALARARSWSAGIRELVSEHRIREIIPHLVDPSASLAEVTPIDNPSEILDQLAQQVGQELPASLVEYIQSVGHVDLFGVRHEPIAASLEGTQTLAKDLVWWKARHAPAHVAGRPGDFEATIDLAPKTAIRIGLLEGDYPFFVHLAERDEAGESPVYLYYHDEAELYWHGASVRDHFSKLLSRVMRAASDQLAQW